MCQKTALMLYNINVPLLELSGFVLNAFTAVVIATLICSKQRATATGSSATAGNMFAYFLVQAVFDCVASLIVVVAPLYYFCDACKSLQAYTLADVVYWIYLIRYAVYVCYSVTSFMHTAAAVDCYLCITKRWLCLQTRPAFFAITGAYVVVAVLFETWTIFSYDILEVSLANELSNVSNASADDIRYFTYTTSDFALTLPHKVLNFASADLRSLLFMLTITTFNLLILNVVRQSMQRKMRLVCGDGGSTTVTNSTMGRKSSTSRRKSSATGGKANAARAERNRSLMIVLTGLNFVLGQTGRAVRSVRGVFFDPTREFDEFWECWELYSLQLMNLSFATPFFFYFFFNKLFGECAVRVLKRVFVEPFVVVLSGSRRKGPSRA